MEWIEQIKAALSWLKAHPEVTWSGLGTSLVIAAVPWFIARLFKKKTSSDRENADKCLAKNRQKLLNRFRRELEERLHFFLFGHSPLHLDKTLAPNEVDHPHSLQDSIVCTLFKNIWQRAR